MLFHDITLVDEHFSIKEHQNIVTDGSVISYIGCAVPDRYDGVVYEGAGKVAMPGFFNVHCHVPMTLLRGYGEGLPLQRWLHERIFPFEALLSGEDVYWASLLGCAELLRSGTASFTDMYMQIENVCRAVMESGIKANLSNGSMALGQTIHYGAGCKDFEEMTSFLSLLSKAERPNGRVRADASLHAEYTAHEAFVREVAQFAKQQGLNLHVHISETRLEHEECKARHGGLTPAAYLDACGIFDVPTTAAHCVWAEESDWAIFARRNVTVAHCPSSNLKLGSGIAPVAAMQRHGVRVGIGTDGASSNNNLNMLEEITLASLLQKGAEHDPALLGPAQVLEMACRNGALSQGRTNCGCIKVGNCADIVVYDLSPLSTQPAHDVLANIFYAADAQQVVLNMVDGEVTYRNGEFTHIDIERVLFEVNRICADKQTVLAASRTAGVAGTGV